MEFPQIKTNNGSLCVIYSMQGGGEYPIHGAYHAGENEWIPIAWDSAGHRINPRSPTSLDITKEVYKIKNESQVQETEGAV